MKRPRVLKLGWEFPPLINGGLGVACCGLSQALAKHVDLTVLVPRAGHKQSSQRDFTLIDNGDFAPSVAKVYQIPISLDPYASGGKRENGTDDFDRSDVHLDAAAGQNVLWSDLDLYGGDLRAKVVEYSKMAAELAIREDFDLIHAHDWITYPAGMEVKRMTGKPLVVHVHATQYDRAGPTAHDWIFDIEKQGMEFADRVVPVSWYTAEILENHYRIDAAKIRPIHNGAAPVVSFVTKKKFPESLVLFLGRLTAQKGPEIFLEIASKVRETVSGVRFVMAGTGEKLLPLIESGAFRGLGGHFHFTGFLDRRKVDELFSMADVYCMPSVSEPFGLSALEAAQFGIPAVISKQSGVSEVLRGALVADFWDVDLMAEHIGRLLAEPGLRERVVASAREDIAAATWDRAAIQVMEVYHELIPNVSSESTF